MAPWPTSKSQRSSRDPDRPDGAPSAGGPGGREADAAPLPSPARGSSDSANGRTRVLRHQEVSMAMSSAEYEARLHEYEREVNELQEHIKVLEEEIVALRRKLQ